MLAEQPMHGYELITALEERSGGRWKPSPGSIYPALRRLEFRELISSTETDGKRRFELTDAGRQQVAEQQEAGNETPWDSHGLGGHGELRRAIAELTGPARQIGRFGTPEQVTAAVATVKTATSSLYRILADGTTAKDDGQVDSGQEDTGLDDTGQEDTD
jgi:DNA-binding PadR family transcriptional regulator